MIDFHGSTGYGQAFTDSITGDWGGKPLVDLQKGLAAALERYPWLDGDRACGPRRLLRRLHDQLDRRQLAGPLPLPGQPRRQSSTLRSMYYSTEELWFPEWELGKPWEKPDAYRAHNPADHVEQLEDADAGDPRRPRLPGRRVPGIPDLYTALQRRGIPSRLLYYPDENHFVLKPHNSMQWHDTVLGWLNRWIGVGLGAAK